MKKRLLQLKQLIWEIFDIDNLFDRHKNGLLLLPKDDRDFTLDKLGFFGFNEYKPKRERFELDTLTVKSQGWNTCSFNAQAVAKEVDENTPLSTRFIVIMANKYKFISGDGFANLRAGEMMMNKYGVCREELLKETRSNWNDYADSGYLTQEVNSDADKHKTKSFFAVKNHNEALEQLDNGHIVKFGVLWRTALNMNGGFSFPWVLDFTKGNVVGGHAICAVGYDLNYQGKQVFICQNSYGSGYGNAGKMYITFEDFDSQISRYGSYVNLDIDKDLARWLITNTGKVVKDNNSPNIYLIEGGKKRLFPDLATFYAHGYLDDAVIADDEAMLPLVPEGEKMDFWKGNNVRTVKAIIQQRKELKNIFEDYFKELFV